MMLWAGVLLIVELARDVHRRVFLDCYRRRSASKTTLAFNSSRYKHVRTAIYRLERKLPDPVPASAQLRLIMYGGLKCIPTLEESDQDGRNDGLVRHTASMDSGRQSQLRKGQSSWRLLTTL